MKSVNIALNKIQISPSICRKKRIEFMNGYRCISTTSLVSLDSVRFQLSGFILAKIKFTLRKK